MSEHTQPTTAGANQSGNVANNTYTSTIASTASTVIGQITGFAALNENSEYPSASTSQDQAQAESQPGSSSATNSTSLGADSAAQEAQTEEEVPSVMARDNFTEENERGPSDPSRPETTQKKIGTETGIPTTAGAGTTLSPDDDVKSAAKKEASLRKNDSAAVGVDYSDQPCPRQMREEPTQAAVQQKAKQISQTEKNSYKVPPSSIATAVRAGVVVEQVWKWVYGSYFDDTRVARRRRQYGRGESRVEEQVERRSQDSCGQDYKKRGQSRGWQNAEGWRSSLSFGG